MRSRGPGRRCVAVLRRMEGNHAMTGCRTYHPVVSMAALLLLAVAFATTALLGIAAPVAASAAGEPYPRLWVLVAQQPHADGRRPCTLRPRWGCRTPTPTTFAALRAANPGITLLGSNNAPELNYVEDDYSTPFNVEMRSASLSWVLTQVGSTLTAGINAQHHDRPRGRGHEVGPDAVRGR